MVVAILGNLLDANLRIGQPIAKKMPKCTKNAVMCVYKKVTNFIQLTINNL